VSVPCGKAPVDRFTNDGRDRDASFRRQRDEALVSFVVKQDLKTVVQRHAHTLASATFRACLPSSAVLAPGFRSAREEEEEEEANVAALRPVALGRRRPERA